MSSVGVGAEQDFGACVLEWENRVGLWDQLVGETLASSGDGFPPEVFGQDGALEVEFASVHRWMLLVASVEFCNEVDEDLASSGPTSLCPEDRAEIFGETLVGDSGASVEATRPEVAVQLVQGLGRLQSPWAIRRCWFSVVEAREAREARGRVAQRVWAMGLVKMVSMAERWQPAWVLQEWKQAAVAGKRGRTVLSGIWVWRGRASHAKQLVAGEAGRMGQIVKSMHNRGMSVVSGSRGYAAFELHPGLFINSMTVMAEDVDRLRSNGLGVWRGMARVRAMGIGRLVEGLVRGQVSWFIGHSLVVCGAGAGCSGRVVGARQEPQLA